MRQPKVLCWYCKFWEIREGAIVGNCTIQLPPPYRVMRNHLEGTRTEDSDGCDLGIDKREENYYT
jgi:hypothetical protein